jgi:hypothetical protein
VNGGKVLIGCTGSVAAIKVPILVQELVNIDDQVSQEDILLFFLILKKLNSNFE